MTAVAAVVLAGGRGSRMGGVHKPALELGGRSLLSRVVAAVQEAGCAPVIVVGPESGAPGAVSWVREEPPFTGPAAAVAAALPSVPTEWMLLLAADLEHPDAAAAALLSARRPGDGAYLTDLEGRGQWLAGVYRTAALASRARELGPGIQGASLRALLAGLDLAPVPQPAAVTADIDTWDHLREARERHPAPGRTPPMAAESPRSLPPEALDAWAAALRERFGLAPEDLPISLVLDLARDVANAVARPAAPFSAFVAGLVAGRAGGSPEQVRDAVAAITSLASDWQHPDA